MPAPAQSRTVFLLTISYRPEVGGVETRLDQIARTLAERGHRVLVYTYQPIITRRRGPAVERCGAIEIRRVQWIGFDLFHKLEKRPWLQMLYLTPYLALRAGLRLLVVRRQVDVIHAAGFNAALAARALHAVLRIPYAVSTHSTYGLQAGTPLARRIAWILRPARAVIAVSSESADELVAAGVDERRVIRHTTWVDLKVFRPPDRAEARRALGLGDEFAVLFVGRMKAVKGIGLILEAARRMPGVRFLLAGTGDLEEDVRAAARECPNLTFLGRIDNDRLAAYYGAADVLLLPSSREGFPRVAAESLACGTPVIVPDMAGIRSAIDARYAVFIDPGVDTIEAAVGEWRLRYAADPGVRAAARAFAERRFSSENVREILQAYGWES